MLKPPGSMRVMRVSLSVARLPPAIQVMVHATAPGQTPPRALRLPTSTVLTPSRPTRREVEPANRNRARLWSRRPRQWDLVAFQTPRALRIAASAAARRTRGGAATVDRRQRTGKRVQRNPASARAAEPQRTTAPAPGAAGVGAARRAETTTVSSPAGSK